MALSQDTSQAASPETIDLLQRILATVEKQERRRWVEITCAVVLALGTMASAWCAYQATLWNGVQTFRLAKSAEASRSGVQNSVAGMQIRAFDGTMFLQYLEAHTGAEVRLEEMLYRRFRPQMKIAVDAWLKTDPLLNPDSPLHPLQMPEYVIAEEVQARQLAEIEREQFSGAQEANRNSDNYVLLTVLFASVLFFSGVAGTVNIPWLRKVLAGLALVFFSVTFCLLLIFMPVCTE